MGGRGYKLFKYLNVIVISNYDSLKSQRNFCHADAEFWRGVPLEITLLLRCSVPMIVPPGASHARFPRNLLGGYEVPLHNESQKSKTLETNYIFSDVTFRNIIQTYRILKIEGEGFGYVQWFIHLPWCMMMLHILESSWGRFEQCLEIA